MPTLQDITTWRGREVVDSDRTGLFGTKVSFAPLRDAAPAGEQGRIAYAKSQVKDAPNIDADGELSPEEERRLYEHYGRHDYGDWDRETDRTETVMGRDERFTSASDCGDAARSDADDATRSEARDVSDPSWDADAHSGQRTGGTTAGEAMTRSEDELRVGTAQRETGRARLRKCVDTETVEQTVPVQREEARVEREPITDANIEQAMTGPEITEAEHEITLRAEEPVVEKRTVPKERVRLETDTVTDEQTVAEDVRRERIEAEGDAERRL